MTLEAALGARVVARTPVGGGCISPAFRATLSDGRTVFVKEAPPAAPANLLESEAGSLEALAATGAVRVPRVLAYSQEWLALEWLEPAPPTAASWEQLGRALARLHSHRSEQWGWDRANCIGPLPQSNARLDDWPAFWRDHRLAPQLERAAAALGARATADCERLLALLDDVLAVAAEDGPSLLHGDLWSGNVHFTQDGAALIDPSCSNGHREVDLAMAALFGGFPQRFTAAYEEMWPLQPGAASRRPVYQLYYLLVHVNLFGGGYVEQTRTCIARALRT